MWNIFDKDETLIGTLFHLCRDVVINETAVQYLDLILDIWITPENTVRILDEDELNEATKSGIINDKEFKLIEKYKNSVLTNYKAIISQTKANTNPFS